jgi:hypothetical protein
MRVVPVAIAAMAVLAVLAVLGMMSAPIAAADDASVPPGADIRCSDFRKLPDGTYLSSPTARLGAKPFANQSVGPRGYNYGDGKLFDAIARKCGR